MKIPDLVAYIFRGSPAGFGPLLARWMADVPRFEVFAEAYRDKIRKKVHGARDEEARRDIQAELAVACWLLQDARFAVEYEPYVASKEPGADFAVTFRTHLRFNLEVKRLREGLHATQDNPASLGYRIMNALCTKLRQMPAGSANLLALVADDPVGAEPALAAGVRFLGERVAADDAAFFLRYSFAHTRAFQRQYGHLSGVVIYPAPDAPQPGPPVLWLNPQARHPLPADLVSALRK